jgi:CubicO group peptidase (beta-lactamase class C family)
MRAGVAFDEDYLATSGAIIAYRKAADWVPLDPGEAPSDLRSFYTVTTERAGPHGGRFHYVSPNTDLLGWVIERATGQRYADLISELIWRPMGAARSAYITVDRLGAPRSAGGICAAFRDLALVGQLIANGGAQGGKQVLPSAWLDDIAARGDRRPGPPATSPRIFRAPAIAANGTSMTATDHCGSALPRTRRRTQRS